jgi:hypothetical protein
MLPIEVFVTVQQKRDLVFYVPPTVLETQEDGEVHNREHVKWELLTICVLHSDFHAQDLVIDFLTIETMLEDHEKMSAGYGNFMTLVLEG